MKCLPCRPPCPALLGHRHLLRIDCPVFILSPSFPGSNSIPSRCRKKRAGYTKGPARCRVGAASMLQMMEYNCIQRHCECCSKLVIHRIFFARRWGIPISWRICFFESFGTVRKSPPVFPKSWISREVKAKVSAKSSLASVVA